MASWSGVTSWAGVTRNARNRPVGVTADQQAAHAPPAYRARQCPGSPSGRAHFDPGEAGSGGANLALQLGAASTCAPETVLIAPLTWNDLASSLDI